MEGIDGTLSKGHDEVVKQFHEETAMRGEFQRDLKTLREDIRAAATRAAAGPLPNAGTGKGGKGQGLRARGHHWLKPRRVLPRRPNPYAFPAVDDIVAIGSINAALLAGCSVMRYVRAYRWQVAADTASVTSRAWLEDDCVDSAKPVVYDSWRWYISTGIGICPNAGVDAFNVA